MSDIDYPTNIMRWIKFKAGSLDKKPSLDKEAIAEYLQYSGMGWEDADDDDAFESPTSPLTGEEGVSRHRFNGIPFKMKEARRWLLWRSVPNEDLKKKPKKVPYYANGTLRKGKLDTPADLAKLATLEEALRALTGEYAGIGFALGPDGTGQFWQGIDFDNLSEHPELVEIIEKLPGYREISPSGNGVHAIGYGRSFKSLGSNGTGIEAYASGRYFTVTGQEGKGKLACLADFVEQRLNPMHGGKSSRTIPLHEPEAAEKVSPSTIADLRSALTFLGADDRNLWVRMGLALKPLGDVGRGLWLDWSATSTKFDPQPDARTWDTFKPKHTGYQAVFTEAQKQGWLNPAKKIDDVNRLVNYFIDSEIDYAADSGKGFEDADDESLLQPICISKRTEPQQITAINSLLDIIEPVDLVKVCQILGWKPGSEGKPPAQKHYKIAIIHVLIETAKRHNWHIIHDAGFFYVYNGACWIALQDPQVKQLLKDAAIRMGYTEIECRDVDFIDKLFQQAEQDGFFKERNVARQSIVNLRNGSLVLSENGPNLKPFDHRDFLTHQLDFDYNPGAINRVFLSYLNQVLPDPDTRLTLQQVAGYLFIKGLKMEKIFFLFGTGANGKSVFFEVLNGVLGTDNISHYSLESLTDDKGYHRAMIKDKIVNYGTDIRLNRIDPGFFKTLASGEPVEARLPYRDPFLMSDYAKLIFNINRLDSANLEHTHGFQRKLLIIPFRETIKDSDQDRDLHKKILENRAGVLNWIIEGAEEVIKNRNIFVSAACEKIKSNFLRETDSVAMFEEEDIDLAFLETDKKGIFVFEQTVQSAHSEYKQYCIEAGYQPLGRNNFAKRMEALGFVKEKREAGWFLKKSYRADKNRD